MSGLSVRLPAPDLPAGRRSALVAATTSYADPALKELRAPAADAANLASVLADPAIGGFEVTQAMNLNAQDLKIAVVDFLGGRSPDELLVIYISCHGFVDLRRRLYFTATDTNTAKLAATGVESTWLLEQLDECRARSQVVILDCCFSGAFARGAKGAEDLELHDRLTQEGRGRAVLTASNAREYAYEGGTDGALVADSISTGSVFTTALLAGLRDGAADANGDGFVTVDEAYDFACAKVRFLGTPQTPQRWLSGGEGQLVLARNPAGRLVAPSPAPDLEIANFDLSPNEALAASAQHLAHGQLAAGVRLLRYCLLEHEEVATLRIALAEFHLHQEQFALAISTCTVVVNDPQPAVAARALILRSRARSLAGKWPEALEDLNTALDDCPAWDLQELLLQRAWVLASLGNSARCREDLQHAEAAPPCSHPYCLSYRGVVHARLGNLEQARALLTEAISGILDPRTAAVVTTYLYMIDGAVRAVDGRPGPESWKALLARLTFDASSLERTAQSLASIVTATGGLFGRDENLEAELIVRMGDEHAAHRLLGRVELYRLAARLEPDDAFREFHHLLDEPEQPNARLLGDLRPERFVTPTTPTQTLDGTYRVLALLSAGIWQTYKCVDDKGQLCVVRYLRRDLAEGLGASYDCTAIAKRWVGLWHPRVAMVLRVTEWMSAPLIVSQYVDHASVWALHSAGSLSPRVALDLVTSCCAAVEFLHANGLSSGWVHMGRVFANTGLEVVRLGFTSSSLEPVGLRERAAVVMPYLARPALGHHVPDFEQAAAPNVNREADLFSLILMLYSLLMPVGDSALALGDARPTHVTGPWPGEINPALPPQLDDILKKGLALHPERRFATGADLAAALKSVAESLPH